MDQRFRCGFTAAEKTKLWDCWRRGYPRKQTSLRIAGIIRVTFRTGGEEQLSIFPTR